LFEELRLRTNELDGQIQKILSKLEMIEFRTSNFADFAKPYKQTIGIYATRIESTLDYIIKKNVVSGNLAEIIILTLYAAQYLKSGIDALLHDIDVKIQSTREEMKKTTQSAEKRVLDAEQRADTAEAKLRATEAESAAIKERSAKAVRPAIKLVQSGITNEAYETLSKKYGRAILIGVITVIISIIIGINQYNKIENLYNSILWQHNQLETKYDTLLNDYNKSKDIWGIHVTSLKTGNADKNNKWLTKPGGQLNAQDIRFLNPYLTVDSLISGNKTFYVKIINPDGTINRNSSSSPEGYSFSKVRYLTIGKNQEVDLDGWGNDDRRHKHCI
jgi:hypothetical protein